MWQPAHSSGDRRPNARERGYSTAWDKARASFLRIHPHCAECAREGLIVRASVVDHVQPHRGDQRLFWSQANWQSLCGNHHSSWKQQVEKRGFSNRIRADGLPSDASHPFYATQGDQPSDDDARQRPRKRILEASPRRVGGSKVVDPKGAGPLGFHRAELVSPRGRR